MDTAGNKGIVRRFIGEVFNAGNLDVVDELVTRDFVNHVAGADVRGPEGMKHFVTTYRAAFPDYHCTIDAQLAEADTVMARWTVRGTQRGALMGILPTGKRVTLTGVVIDRVADGRLAESWLQADMLGLLQQLGVIPVPEQAAMW